MPNEDEVTTHEEIVEEVQEETYEPQEDIEELKKKLATLEAQKEHWREKATKAVERKPEVVNSPANTLTPGDLIAITNAKINAEDMDRVDWFAKSNGISLREALEHPEMKAILEIRNEQRQSAIASNVESVRRGSAKMSEETLLNNARMGKLPTTDDEIEALVQAQSKYRRS